MKSLILIIMILCILFGIGSGVYFEFFDDSAAESNTINWKKGLFRIAVIISIVGAVVIGSIFALLAIKGKLVDKDDDDDEQKYFKNPKKVFFWFCYSIFRICVVNIFYYSMANLLCSTLCY